ncbi:tyrosine-type recombinase/integrase [Parvularcula dongshanensis]|uniref:Integrase n=1 Tax=Parvularcula dongshanensis TaxID=1173995 RepID=A0A840HZU5_9PROT|nr:site-specific integrase [Parvularcula dongshanensis]MBB4657534.1 integrase [Parvularcula dongshanensis]
MTNLTAIRVQKIKEPGRYTDGGSGVILQVRQGRAGRLSKSWLLRYSFAGRRREVGLGAYPVTSLAEAREQALAIRKSIALGADPIADREARKARAVNEAARASRFADCAQAYINAHEPTWKNPKHRQQWRNTLATYAYPVIGDMDVADIETEHVLRVVEPLWYEKTETANRVRGRIEAVLAYAIARGYRKDANPATWRGQLNALLPARSRVAPVRHHEALPYAALPAFMVQLRVRSAPAARALELLILTCVRSFELRGMVWNEVDWSSGVWTIPKDRSKTDVEHRVPLSTPMLTLLLAQLAVQGVSRPSDADASGYVFPNQSGTGPYSDSVWRALFRRMGHPKITAHGFRSTFRDWCGETTNFPRELAEHALGHQVGNAVELAYRRGDALERRRPLMEQWSTYVLAELNTR